MNAANVGKRGREFYQEIGFACIDELHLIMAESLSNSLQFLVPRYILGLSATPYRMDGLDPLINLYFGKRRIHRKLYRKHTVYQVNTNFTPEMEMASNGRVNWSSVIDSQATSAIRNEMIIRIVKHFKDRVFLILVKRIEQGEYLVNRLLEEKEDVTSLIGKQQEFDQSSRILVGTTGKTSCGFDHPRLDAMILAADIVQYFIQTLGRVMRREDVEPIIFDLVDNNGILLKHYKERRAVYLEHGGTITNFNKEFPEFKVYEK
jgi:superfamily II DNA or RNA helicase